MRMMSSMMGGGGTNFKNIKDKLSMTTRFFEILDRKFLKFFAD
jgi:hypothetical protein